MFWRNQPSKPSDTIKFPKDKKISSIQGPAREYSRSSANVYYPLRLYETRVLVLQPGECGDDLEGDFEYVTISHVFVPSDESTENNGSKELSKSACEAISYAWGPPNRPHRILIGDDGIIPITASLHEALQHLRYTNHPRVLWADAICINQEDLNERSAQVAAMKDIFSSCDRVLVWLGSAPQTDLLVDEIVEMRYRKDHLPSSLTSEDVLSLQALKEVYELTRRPWFDRLWVLQESAPGIVSEVIFCSGHFRWSREELASAFRAVSSNWLAVQQVARPGGLDETAFEDNERFLGQAHVAGYRQGKELQGLLMYRTKKCTDPRDRVYALRYLLGVQHVAELSPDYTISERELYRRLMVHCLTSRSAVLYSRTFLASLLGLVGTESESQETMKTFEKHSWVPNFNKLSSASQRKVNMYTNWNLCDSTDRTIDWTSYDEATKMMMAAFTPTVDEYRRLRVRGHVFAKTVKSLPLASIFRPRSLDCRAKDDVNTFIDWYLDCRKHIQMSRASDRGAPSVQEHQALRFMSYPTYWGSTPKGRDMRLEAFDPDDLMMLRTACLERSIAIEEELLGWLAWMVQELPQCPLAKAYSLWLIETPDRRDVAWLPIRTEEGDQICMFDGAPWPFVVRGRGKAMRLIGDGHTFSIPLDEVYPSLRPECPEGVERSLFSPGQPLGLNMLGQENFWSMPLDIALNPSWIVLE